MAPIHNRSSSGIIGFNLDNKIVSISNGILSSFQTDSIANIGDISELFSQYPILLNAISNAKKGLLSQVEINLDNKSFLVEITKGNTLLQEADLAAVFSDISNFSEKVQSMIKENNKLTEINSELEQFAYVTSHDLTEPLRMISNFSQLLNSEYRDKLDEKALAYFKYITEGSQRVQFLINDLLLYNRASRAKVNLQETNCEDIVLLQVYKLKNLIKEKNAVINVESSGNIYGDPKLLGQIFYQLIKNGINYNENETPEININFHNKGDEYKIEIKDNGIGINKEHKEMVFEILKRVNIRPGLGGSGIGLSLCKKLVQLHGGKIWFDSELEKGTTFYIILPKNLKPLAQ